MMLALATAHASFWSSSSAVAVVVGVCALIVGAAVAFLARRRRTSVRARVERFVSPVPDPATAGDATVRRRPTLPRERWLDELSKTLEIARITKPAGAVVRLTIGLTMVAAVLLGLLTGSPLGAIIALAAGPVLARSLIDARLTRTRAAFGDQLPSHLQELAAAMRSGRSMVAGIALMAEDAAEPTQGEFRRVMADEELGMPLSDALSGVVTRMKAPDMEPVSLVAGLQSKTGGNMAEVLDRVAESVRERAELTREVKTLTAQARMSRVIVVGLPPTLVLLIAVLNPGYLNPLFHTSTGHVLIVVALLLMALGSWVMGRIVRIEA